MRSRAAVRRALVLTTPVVAGWVVDALTPLWASLVWRLVTSVYSPSLPLVALPAGSTTTDVRSCVPALFVALIAGGLSALPVELSKAHLSGRNRLLTSFFLVAYQLLLLVDILRTHARDWWVWMLSWFGLFDLNSVDWRKPMLPIQSPWLALIGLIVTVAWLARVEVGKDRIDRKESD